ncbi:serine carboxypeptidase [Aulographum hederae CBS 113979]|uniref:Carboxypeptidase n=1 Tax=Aulographum hederae CBS 113979 TaxID=1176131 RepID=A0A6G1H760_9PEZI|nr:serine carboxypeptidase [Aulographum hederae CBS 113979]
MRLLLSSFLSVASLLLLFASETSAANQNAINAFKRANRASPAEKREAKSAPPLRKLEKRSSPYLNNVTEKFVVNGSAIPDVDFDIGESYAGLLPISSAPNETRQLYFWFFPSSNPLASDEVTIWFNGGPGCSSLSGLLTENGPFTWEAGTLAPVQNPYTWVNLTNMLWVEQPVGVGFSQGTPNITNEVELGQQFIGFYKQFVDAFQLKGRKTYLTGESYAGYYVPYVADAFLSADDKDYYNLAGVAINDPIIGDGTIQQEAVIYPFIEYWSELFYLNSTFMDVLKQRHIDCGYADYLDKYMQFPPPAGKFPVLPDPFANENYTCDIFDDAYSAALEVNPCFNIYHITDTCPHLYSQLGIVNTGDYSPPAASIYFNRTSVQRAINAPVGTHWLQCSALNVFGGASDNQSLSDTSLSPAQSDVLTRVIEATNNTLIGVGNLDFLLAPNGTLLALQNVTWNGAQGFQSWPGEEEFYVPYHPEYNGGALSAAGVVGGWGKERGLTFYTVQLSGHELPGYAPGAAYRVVEVMLGRTKDLGTVGDFSTQSGNYTGNSTVYRRDLFGEV